jgi:hypothetical protein
VDLSAYHINSFTEFAYIRESAQKFVSHFPFTAILVNNKPQFAPSIVLHFLHMSLKFNGGGFRWFAFNVPPFK